MISHLKNQDCRIGMMAIKSGTVDVVVTSPPYNIGKKYGRKYDDGAARDRFLNWCADWILEVERVLAPGGSFFLNVGSSPSNPMLPFELVNICRTGFVLQNTFHWIKSITIDSPKGKVAGARESVPLQTLSVGHFKPINSRVYVNDLHEYVLHFTKTGRVPIDRLAVGVPYQDATNAKRWKAGGGGKRCRGNVWFVPYRTIQKARAHPAEYPVELAENCIRLHAGARVILDPFLGGGNSGIAALNCGAAEFYGIEIESEYFEIARQRITGAK
jgi:site-specific DNA-methyltransferase (adenine-specific)